MSEHGGGGKDEVCKECEMRMPKLSGDGTQFSQGASYSLVGGRRGSSTRHTGAHRGPAALTFSFFLSSALPAGPGAAGPPRVPLPTSPLRCAALTLGGVMAAAAEVSGMRGRAPGAGGWWPCCGDTAG